MQRMYVSKVAIDPQQGPVVVLATENEERLMRIYIGHFEAYAIAAELEQAHFPRPLTHDLMRTIIGVLGYTVARVEVTRLQDGIFYGLIHLDGPSGKLEIDSRPSDALALAVRAEAPVFVADEVLDQAEVVPPEVQEAREAEALQTLLSGLDESILTDQDSEDETGE